MSLTRYSMGTETMSRLTATLWVKVCPRIAAAPAVVVAGSIPFGAEEATTSISSGTKSCASVQRIALLKSSSVSLASPMTSSSIRLTGARRAMSMGNGHLK